MTGRAKSLRSALLIVLLAATLQGCGDERPKSDHVTNAWGRVDLTHENPPAPVRAGPESASSVLVVSGGGADGAFGVGLLLGWAETGTRPNFDIITGVSTGAIIATFTFLGPQYEEKLRAAYASTSNKDLFADNGFFAPFYKASMRDSAPMRTILAKLVDEPTLDAIAEEYKKGRRLYVATVDLDAAELCVWDMGAIAASQNRDRLALYRDIIMASTAVPGVFSPVYLQTQTPSGSAIRMHVDGGIMSPLLLREFMLAGSNARKDVYVVVNAYLKSGRALQDVSPRVPKVSSEGTKTLYRALVDKTVYQSYVMTVRSGANFHLAYIPDDATKTRDPLSFHPDEMNALFNVGQQLGRDGIAAWHSEPPRLSAFERVMR